MASSKAFLLSVSQKSLFPSTIFAFSTNRHMLDPRKIIPLSGVGNAVTIAFMTASA